MSTPDIEEGPPISEGPPEDDAGPYTPATTAIARQAEGNTDVILEARDDPPPAIIFSEVSAVLLVASGDDRLRVSDWRVLVNLCGRADKRRECYPGVPRIARETGIHERTVGKSLAHLRDLGYLSSRPRRFKLQQRSSLRRLLIPEVLPEGHPYQLAREGLPSEGSGGLSSWPGLGVPYGGRHKPSNELHQGTPLKEVEAGEEEEEEATSQLRSEEKDIDMRAVAQAFREQRDRRLRSKEGWR